MMEKSSKWLVCILIILLAMIFIRNPYAWSANSTALGNPPKLTPGNNNTIPAFKLPLPENEEGKSYLGLSGTGNFTIGQIKAQVLIIEVYSFYCPHCQRSADQVNELYRKIQETPDLKEKVKMIGIAVTNGAYEVDAYRKRYKVPFPLFADASMEISQKLGVKGTPTFIGVKIKGKGYQERFYFSEGGIEDMQQFLAKIIELSGLK
jgi:peroxiredoxin